MCGQKKATSAAGGVEQAYEGQTTRLEQATRQHACRAFPWWTLWLIWPLVAVLKTIGASIGLGWSALGGVLLPANVLLAIALIVIGAVLLVRQQRR